MLGSGALIKCPISSLKLIAIYFLLIANLILHGYIYKHSLILVRKYAQIIVCGQCLFRAVTSCLRM